MKKIALLAITAAAAIATPAMAQSTTGTIIINGTVGNKCTVLTGTGTAATWGGTVNLGELSQADGTLRSSSSLSTDFAAAGSGVLQARIVCTSANPSITVNADPLVNTAPVTAGQGYTNTVHFQADVAVTKVSGSSTFSNDSNAATTGPTAVGDRLAATGNNVSVSTTNWRTVGTDTQLVSGNYQGQIVVTIAP
ncbi:MAG TPA: hypothetical protein VFV30_00925 [Novosphingobium sp.]|nr:hypothetical protein [Novosphingobium sp.]